MDHFISVLGLDKNTNDLDVRFYKSVAKFSEALSEKVRLDSTVGPQATMVIYRMSYDATSDEFYSSRQLNLQVDGGSETYAGEPAKLEPLAYELFSVPVALLTSGAEAAMRKQVEAILNRSHSERPGKVRP